MNNIEKIASYKKIIETNIGKEVSLYVKRGRKSLVVNNCVIDKAYNNIFTVKIIGESLISERILSVCYADLLTGQARIKLQIFIYFNKISKINKNILKFFL